MRNTAAHHTHHHHGQPNMQTTSKGSFADALLKSKTAPAKDENGIELTDNMRRSKDLSRGEDKRLADSAPGVTAGAQDTRTSSFTYDIARNLNPDANGTKIETRGMAWSTNDKVSNRVDLTQFEAEHGAANTVFDTTGNDLIKGSQGNDYIFAGHGQDRIDAGDGYDAVRLSGNAGDYSIKKMEDGSITALNSRTGAFTKITNAEELTFNNGTLKL